MKVAILSESSADEAAVRVLVEALLEQPTEPVALNPRSRGWPSVLQVLPKVLLHLHFHTDADGLIVVVDTNGSPLQAPAPDEPAGAGPIPRSEQLLAAVREFHNRHPERPGRPPLQVAIGVAAPAIEAWYLCGRDQRASEVSWIREMREGARPRDRVNGMKQTVYGTDRPSLELETEHAVQEAHRIARDTSLLERAFPVGFGLLARAIHAWKDVT